MALLKSYTCSKCAGVLVFDGDQDFFDCPFCGTRFDVMEFHGDEVMEQAKSLLKKESFDAAREKYLSVLENDPGHFEANLGVVLCDLKITTPDALEFPEVIPDNSIIRVKRAVTNARKQSDELGAQYFGKILELINIKERVNKIKKERDELLSDVTSRRVNQKMLTDARADRQKNRMDWLPGVIYGVFTLGMAMVYILMFYGMKESDNRLVIPFVVAIAVVGLIIAGIKIADKIRDRNYDPAGDIAQGFQMQIRSKYNAYTEEFRKLKSLYPPVERIKKMKAAERDAEENSSGKSTSVNYDEIDPSEIVICSKCAAKLSLNKEKRVYQCDHCGVAYGVSLFFGLPMEKALNSLNTGLYDDADQRFGNILMVRPNDFEALLGRALCVGGWTKISDIDLTDEVDESSLATVRMRLEEAKQHAAVHNVPFFENVEKLIGYCSEYKKNREMISGIDSEVSKFDANTTVMHEAYHGRDFRIKREKERKELVSKAFPLRAKNKKIESDFRDLRRSITEMRDDSVLCK
ncbi:MAG: hypothetical protein K5881_02160 [Saccharofermentans sp.]|nr:hypothetical protein [Saccharofermentans sp.]